jgi:hypothetical protein
MLPRQRIAGGTFFLAVRVVSKKRKLVLPRTSFFLSLSLSPLIRQPHSIPWAANSEGRQYDQTYGGIVVCQTGSMVLYFNEHNRLYDWFHSVSLINPFWVWLCYLQVKWEPPHLLPHRRGLRTVDTSQCDWENNTSRSVDRKNVPKHDLYRLLINAICLSSSHFCRCQHYINEQNWCWKCTNIARCGDMHLKASCITHQHRFNCVYYAECRIKWKNVAECSLSEPV